MACSSPSDIPVIFRVESSYIDAMEDRIRLMDGRRMSCMDTSEFSRGGATTVFVGILAETNGATPVVTGIGGVMPNGGGGDDVANVGGRGGRANVCVDIADGAMG